MLQFQVKVKKYLNPTKVKYPCGGCGQACMDMVSLKDPQFEHHSVQCDKWYHLICVHLKGNEPELQEGSTLEYFCPTCHDTEHNVHNSGIQPSTSKNDDMQCVQAPSVKGKGCGGKVHPKNNEHKRRQILAKKFPKMLKIVLSIRLSSSCVFYHGAVSLWQLHSTMLKLWTVLN